MDTKIWEPNTGHEIEIQAVELDSKQTRCWNLLNMEQKVLVKDQFKNV